MPLTDHLPQSPLTHELTRPVSARASDSWFLGPKGENSELLATLIQAALDTHVRWRRSFHPEDPSPVGQSQQDSRTPTRYTMTLARAFDDLLARLSQSVPSFSGRYCGHMLSEQTIASQAAYFAAMLYNPNNVSLEVSPVTTQLEVEVADQLATMIGYDTEGCWGHLTSGGTVANFEALWIARNVFYHPVAVASVARQLSLSLDVAMPDGTRCDVKNLELWDLLNVRPSASLDLWDALWSAGPRDDVAEALRDRSLATLGYQDYSRKLAAEFGDPLPAGVVLTGATAHYSWEKIVRALGIGANQLVSLPVDAECRIDPDVLWQSIVALSSRKIPIMACITVCGTTEEGSIDPIDDIVNVRARAERELGVTFHIHTDACYGGYAASITRARNGSRRTAVEIRHSLRSPDWPTEKWVRSISALESVDSISIDPHKLGYIPYPSGAFLLKDRRARELVATDPPYLAAAETAGATPSIGRFIFEGSKPGAAAAAVWMSQKTIPLDCTGYGALIGSTITAAHRLRSILSSGILAPFEVAILPGQDLNIVCFVLHHPAVTSVAQLNALNEAIYAQLRGGSQPVPEYIITRTRLSSPGYDEVATHILEEIGDAVADDWRAHSSAGLVVLRITVMNPFAGAAEPDYLSGVSIALKQTAEAVLPGLI